jgi:O-antigen ligase
MDALWVPCLWVFISSIRDSLHPGPEQISTKGHPYPIILMALLILGAIILYARRFNLWVFIKENKLVVLLYCWRISLKRWVKTIGSLEMVLIILTMPDVLAAFSSVIRRYFYLVIPLSIILIFFFPSLGLLAQPDGDITWVGLFGNKNSLGQAAMILSVYFAWRFTQKVRERTFIFDYLPALLSLCVLFGSRSVTSIFAFLFGLAIFFISALGKFKRRYTGVIITYVSVFAVVIYLLVQITIWKYPIMAQVIESFGKDVTLTGRVDLWSDLWPIALMRPFLGYGFGGFWMGDMNPVLKNQLAKWGWQVPNAHNGYLSVFIEMGIVGVIIVSLLILMTYVKISRLFSVHFELARLKMVILVVLLLHNLSEVSLCDLNNPLWFLFLFSAVSLPFASISEESPAFYIPRHGFPFFRNNFWQLE